MIFSLIWPKPVIWFRHPHRSTGIIWPIFFTELLAVWNILKPDLYFRKKYPEPGSELFGYGASDRQVTPEELTENEKAWKKRLNRTSIEFVEEAKVKYPFAFLDKMIRMVEEKKIPFLFVYLPEYGSKLKNPKYESYYKTIAPVLIPPQLIFDDVSNWMDASHLNDKGSGLLSDWMANQLTNEFCTEKQN